MPSSRSMEVSGQVARTPAQVLQLRILLWGLIGGPFAEMGRGSFAALVVVADLGAGAVDLAPEDPAGLVQAVG